MTCLFLDTEWADAVGAELVSLALISENGQQVFYAERPAAERGNRAGDDTNAQGRHHTDGIGRLSRRAASPAPCPSRCQCAAHAWLAVAGRVEVATWSPTLARGRAIP